MSKIYCMDKGTITVTGIEQYQEALRKMQTDNPKTKKELQAIIRRAIIEARKNVVKDAQGVLENDPRHAYKAVRNSVYKQIFGGQINILSGSRRGNATKWVKPTKNRPGNARGGNRRKRSTETMRYDSYEGADRGFILRFLNAGTAGRKIENFVTNPKRNEWPSVPKWNKNPNTGNRGSLRARHWFGISSTFQLDAAATKVAEEIENLLQQEFHQM